MSMKHSMKANRMARHHARNNKKSALNLTSLMDIFTILVFFLMVNSSDVQVIKNTDTIEMPKSIADVKPKDGIMLIQIDANSITIDKDVVALVEEVSASEEEEIASLKPYFERYSKPEADYTEEEKALGLPVAVQGDKAVPYVVLRKVMATAAKENFRDIGLAVSQTPIKVSDVQEN